MFSLSGAEKYFWLKDLLFLVVGDFLYIFIFCVLSKKKNKKKKKHLYHVLQTPFPNVEFDSESVLNS